MPASQLGGDRLPKRGLIVGKFWPPHRGHKFLIDSGRAQTDHLTVIVCQRPHETPSGDLRASWLREIHPDVHVLLVDDTDDEQDYKIWRENSICWLGFIPDVLFTSEDYGAPFAQALGCEHILIDRARKSVPISGTQIRSASFENWHFLEAPVRAWYALRICLVGAESTGKTTLAQALAAHYETAWIPEYAREYSERKIAAGSTAWSSSEFIGIAQTQCDRENTGARAANRILICDTDAFATTIWYERYFGKRSPELEAIAAKQKHPDLYLLTDIDIPFQHDNIRDGEGIRTWMHQTFKDELTRQKRPFKLLSGAPEERLAQAIAEIDKLFSLGT